MNKKTLAGFLIKAKRDGYASGETTTEKENDGSNSTRCEIGDFKFHDNWFGGEPFGGREVVWFKNKPVWMMIYYGEESSHDEKAIPTLRKALSAMPDEMPARGPKALRNGEYAYKNNWQGDIEKFSGEESISKNDKIVYNAKYVGGLVDQEKE